MKMFLKERGSRMWVFGHVHVNSLNVKFRINIMQMTGLTRIRQQNTQKHRIRIIKH